MKGRIITKLNLVLDNDGIKYYVRTFINKIIIIKRQLLFRYAVNSLLSFSLIFAVNAIVPLENLLSFDDNRMMQAGREKAIIIVGGRGR